MEESRRQFVAALTAGVTGALAGCGGSETPTGTATGTDAGTPTGAGAETPTGAQTPTDDGSNPSTEAAQTVTVAPSGEFRFEPKSFTLAAGETVTWEWAAGGHNVAVDSAPDGSDWTGTSGSGTFGSGHSYSETFEVTGEYSYYCAPHRSRGMTGSFTVSKR